MFPTFILADNKLPSPSSLIKAFSPEKLVFGKNNSQREFYTAPVTTIPNNQGDFADWCYKTGKTCKENNGKQCLENISFQPNR